MTKEIFVSTGGTDRTTVVAKAAQRSVMFSESMLPCIVSPVYDGKTILIVVKKGKVSGVFNRLGQAYPMKDKLAASGFAPMGTLIKKFFDVDGVYQAQLTASTVNRAKIKAIISTARSTPLTAPEKLLVEGTILVVLTDYFTLEEFNGDIKKAPQLIERLGTLQDIVISSTVDKEFPQFVLGTASIAFNMEEVSAQLCKGSLLVRESTGLVEPAKQEEPEQEEPKKAKKKKASKSEPLDEEPPFEEDKPKKKGKKAKKESLVEEPVVEEPKPKKDKKAKKKKSKK
jgi:hypothetical protein